MSVQGAHSKPTFVDFTITMSQEDDIPDSQAQSGSDGSTPVGSQTTLSSNVRERYCNPLCGSCLYNTDFFWLAHD